MRGGRDVLIPGSFLLVESIFFILVVGLKCLGEYGSDSQPRVYSSQGVSRMSNFTDNFLFGGTQIPKG